MGLAGHLGSQFVIPSRHVVSNFKLFCDNYVLLPGLFSFSGMAVTTNVFWHIELCH